jgi:hypothetical protein
MATKIYVSTNREADSYILALLHTTERRMRIHTSRRNLQPWCQK